MLLVGKNWQLHSKKETAERRAQIWQVRRQWILFEDTFFWTFASTSLTFPVIFYFCSKLMLFFYYFPTSFFEKCSGILFKFFTPSSCKCFITVLINFCNFSLFYYLFSLRFCYYFQKNFCYIPTTFSTKFLKHIDTCIFPHFNFCKFLLVLRYFSTTIIR